MHSTDTDLSLLTDYVKNTGIPQMKQPEVSGAVPVMVCMTLKFCCSKSVKAAFIPEI